MGIGYVLCSKCSLVLLVDLHVNGGYWIRSVRKCSLVLLVALHVNGGYWIRSVQ